MGTFCVYVLMDVDGNIIAPPESTAFNSEESLIQRGYIKIDEGTGDRYTHAQGDYLGGPVFTSSGVARYRVVDGAVVERAAEEIAVDEAAAGG